MSPMKKVLFLSFLFLSAANAAQAQSSASDTLEYRMLDSTDGDNIPVVSQSVQDIDIDTASEALLEDEEQMDEEDMTHEDKLRHGRVRHSCTTTSPWMASMKAPRCASLPVIPIPRNWRRSVPTVIISIHPTNQTKTGARNG